VIGVAQKGRKYKLLEQSSANLTVQQQEAKYNAEVLTSDGYKLLQISPPSYLSNTAKTEWKRIAPDLNKLPVRALDRAMVENYCTWYAMFKDTTKLVNKQAEPEKKLEYIGILDKITKNLKTCASELGLTVDSRMRLNIPHEDKKKTSLKDMFS